MHVPKPFELESPDLIARILRDERFGLLVSVDNAGAPNATPIPFLYEGDGRGGRLLGHIAAANPQAGELRRMAASGTPALAVFQGPHAYISPRWYGEGNHVPTWNYVAVHVSGVPAPIDDPDAVAGLLTRLSAREEAGRDAPWTPDELPADMARKLRAAVLAFELPLTRVQAKAKLGQNKPAAARDGLRAGLAREGTADADALLAWMDTVAASS